MLKAVPKRQPEPLRDCDFPSFSGLELTPEFWIEDAIPSTTERSMFSDHYLRNISIKQLAETYKISPSSVYRLLSKLKKELANVT
jgi:hypothetical protein